MFWTWIIFFIGQSNHQQYLALHYHSMMATFPNLPDIVGKHGGIYEAYYMQADPLGTGSIGALDAANFLKKSKLKDTTLSKVWDLSDPMGKGYLEKQGFFVALKLISLVQNSQEMAVAKLSFETPAPDLGPVEPVDTSAQNAMSLNVPWDISLSEKSKYDKVFDSLQPVNNMLGGDKVKPILMNSKLPVDILGKIWDLSDIDKDGCLDRDEFAVAMHLVYQAREGQEIPNILKAGLIPPSKRKGAGIAAPPMAGAVPVLPIGVSAGITAPLGRATPPLAAVSSPPTWVVSQTEKAASDLTFAKLDTDGDGLVSGIEMRDVLAQSGLPNNVLAHIWSLCDSQNQGKLTSEQFALAMHLIQQTLKGVEPPSQLTPEMLPPSQRSVTDPGAFGVRDGPNVGPYGQLMDLSAVKELDQISKEIEDIKKERLQLERDKAQQEADIKIRHSEVQVLQKELDSLNGTLTQLDSQKKEAQKRLDELDDKRSNLERNVKEMREKTDTEQMEVNKMKSLLSNRDQVIKDQEKELTNLRSELTQLRDEESKLEQTMDSGKQQLDSLSKSHADINKEIEQTKSRIKKLKEQYKGVENGLSSNGVLSNVEQVSSVSSLSGFSNVSTTDFKDDPFKDQDPFGQSNTDLQADPFQDDDPFRDSDPFKSSDPFGNEDPFKDAFGTTSTAKSDPFANLDAFGGGTTTTSTSKSGDNFDAFGASWGTGFSNKSSQQSASLANDPFGDLGSKPSPAKTKKAPPPRPAPPKSKSPLPFSTTPSKPKVEPFGGFDSDPFGGSDPFSGSGATKNNANSGSDPFANFADFSPGKFDDNDAWGGDDGGGPSTITIDTSHSRPLPAKRNITLAGGSSGGGVDASDA